MYWPLASHPSGPPFSADRTAHPVVVPIGAATGGRRTPVHCGAAVGPEYLFCAIELAPIHLSGPSAPILAVRVDQMTAFIDSGGIFPHQDLRGGHSHPLVLANGSF